SVGVDVGQVVGEGTDVVVVVLGPAGEVVALQLAARPRGRERRVLGLAALDRALQRRPELVPAQQFSHRGAFLLGPLVFRILSTTCRQGKHFLIRTPSIPSTPSWPSWPSSAPGAAPVASCA